MIKRSFIPSGNRALTIATLLVLLGMVTLAEDPLLRGGILLAGAVLALLARIPRNVTLRRLFVTLSCALAVVMGLASQRQAQGVEQLLQMRYAQALDQLQAQGRAIAGALGDEWPVSRSQSFTREGPERLRLFRLAQQTLVSSSGPGSSLFIVDSDGVAEAWAGGGLRHALPENDLPQSGLFVLSSFTASTLGFVAAVPGSNEGERVVVGASFSSTQLPEFLFAPVWLRPFSTVRVPTDGGRLWSIRDLDGSAGLELRLRDGIEAGVHPYLVVLILLVLIVVLASEFSEPLFWRWATIWRTTGNPGESLGSADRITGSFSDVPVTVLFPIALIAVAVGGKLMQPSVAIALALFVGIALLAAFVGRWTQEGLLRSVCVFVLSLSIVGSLWLTTGGIFGGPENLDLRRVGLRLDIPFELAVLSLASWVAFAIVLVSLGRRGPPQRSMLPLPLAGSVVTLVLAHLSAHWILGALLVGVAGWLLSIGLGLFRVRSFVALGVGASLIAASTWSVVLIGIDRQELEKIASPTTSSFSEEGRNAQRTEVEEFLRTVDLDELTLGLEQEESQARDLALLLWLASPLSEASGPSGLQIETDASSEFFGFGLVVDSNGAIALKSTAVTDATRRWAREALVYGSADIIGDGSEPGVSRAHRSARVNFFVIPTPRFLTSREREASDLARRFLLGERFSASRWSAGFALTAGPWSGTAGVVLGRDAQVRETQRVLQANRQDPISSPGKGAIAEQWFEESFSLVRFYPPVRPHTDRLLRSAVQVSSNLIVALCLLLLLGLAVLVRRRSAAQLLGPFSRRLILAFALLASVPIVLISGLLLQSFSDRLQTERRADGEAALSSAERMIGDYLSSLDPGFSVTAVLDDALLTWISSIVHHEVNLYWRGNVLTSSRPELFSAGLLPSQIPGDVFAALDLEGGEVAARINRSGGDTHYLELYRRVQLPGGSGGFGLFVSVPMLAQELETTFALRAVLNQALVLATFLILLLVIIAVRFAELLTKPITEIVAGTQRIGSGDHTLGLRPSIPELQRLALAIDEMASKIASGRERLLREKRVVDTVIANIKSAVVSFGENETVILSNRVAADLLHVRPGDSLEELTARLESKELARIVRLRPTVAERTSVRLGDSEDPQEWIVQWLPISGVGDPAALLVMEDVTEVLRAQRLSAWAEMARIIAHEVKNPLTPIRLSADHLRRVYEATPDRLGEVFDRCIDNILAQVDELRLIAGEFSTYSRIPTSNKSLADLGGTVREVLESYRSGASSELAFTCDLVEGEVFVEHDRRLIGRVLRNLYENAIRACAGKGRVHLRLEIKSAGDALFAHGAVLIEVLDSGPGVPPEDLPRIFEPSFSASTGGTGLGLPIARSIVNDHGGQIIATNAKDTLSAVNSNTGVPKNEPGGFTLKGLRVSIHLPFDSRAAVSETDPGEGP